jgi:hypothetical protein
MRVKFFRSNEQWMDACKTKEIVDEKSNKKKIKKVNGN